MRTGLMTALAVFVCVLASSAPMLAHHSASLYDTSHLTVIKGTVTSFEYSNPHGYIYVETKDDKGNVEKWAVETQSPNMLFRAGWRRDMIKVGDTLTASGYAARNGQKIIRMQGIELSTGEKFTVYKDTP